MGTSNQPRYKLGQWVFELIPIFVLMGILFAGIFISSDELPSKTLCLAKQMLGIDCPGCGMSRAFLLIPRGELLHALHLNAASVALYLLFIIMLATLIGRRFQKNFFSSPFWSQTRFYLAQLVIFLLIGHWIAKLYLFFSVNPIGEYLKNLTQDHSLWPFL